jgi:hypothetical protein
MVGRRKRDRGSTLVAGRLVARPQLSLETIRLSNCPTTMH